MKYNWMKFRDLDEDTKKEALTTIKRIGYKESDFELLFFRIDPEKGLVVRDKNPVLPGMFSTWKIDFTIPKKD
jgi:hypothetical protein